MLAGREKLQYQPLIASSSASWIWKMLYQRSV